MYCDAFSTAISILPRQRVIGAKWTCRRTHTHKQILIFLLNDFIQVFSVETQQQGFVVLLATRGRPALRRSLPVRDRIRPIRIHHNQSGTRGRTNRQGGERLRHGYLRYGK